MKFKPLLFIIVLIFTIITAQSISCEDISKKGVYHVGPYKITIVEIDEIIRNTRYSALLFKNITF